MCITTPKRGDQMKIVRYYPRAWKGDGGITNSVRRISEAQVEAGAAVRIGIDGDTADDPLSRLSWASLRHTGAYRFRYPQGLEHLLEDADLLVLHSGWVFHNVYAARLARRMGVPYILEPRGAYDLNFLNRRRTFKMVWWLLFERRLLKNAAAVHVFFSSQGETLRRLGYDGPIICAPNGVSIPDESLWDGGSGGYVLWLGRFDPECKGLDLLLQALHCLPPAERPPLRLHGPDWVGGKQRVIELIDEMGLEEWVSVGDAIYGDEKSQLVSRARAFVYPSRWEGFGNAAAEAVGAGVPTLVTPYPLGRWLAERGAAIMSPATITGLADGLRAVTSPDAALMARDGQYLVSQELTWDAVGASWLDQAAAAIDTRQNAPARQLSAVHEHLSTTI